MLKPLSVLVLVLAAESVPAVQESQILGARARGLGGAFTAVADDVTAFYWNPAGVARGPFVRLGAFWGTAFRDRDELVESLQGAQPGGGSTLSGSGAAGFSAGITVLNVAATRFTYTDTELDGTTLRTRGLKTTDIVLTFVQSLPPDDLIVGLNVHYIRGTSFKGVRPAADVPSSEQNVKELTRWATESGQRAGSESEPGLDLGVLYQPGEWVRLGFSARNLTRPDFFVGGNEEIVFEAHARAGVALYLPRSVLVAMDVDLNKREEKRGGVGYRELALGVEKGWWAGRLTLRGGVQAELGGVRSTPGFSSGLGLEMRGLRLDLAVTTSTRGRRGALWFGASLVR